MEQIQRLAVLGKLFFRSFKLVVDYLFRASAKAWEGVESDGVAADLSPFSRYTDG
jgi:hypothetical protein